MWNLNPKDVAEAIQLEDADKITDFKEYAKTSKTVNMDPARFECIMNKTALRQEPMNRLYMDALPSYNGEEKAAEIKAN